MPYYCNYNGTGYLTAPTLGNLLTANKIRVVIKRLKVVGDGFIFSQSGAGSAREFGVLYSGGSLNYIYGSSTERAVLSTAETSSNFGSGGYFDLTFDNTANTVVLRNDVGGTIKSVSLVKGGSRIDGMLFRLGARCGNDTTDTSGGFMAANGTWIGDVAIYINDVLVRNYITPSGGTTIPDSVGGNDLTQRGTWPTGDGEWIFYSSGASYTLTADGAAFSYSGGIASTIFNRSLSADGGSFGYSGGAASTLLNRRIAADGATFGYSGGASALLYGRALQAAGGSFSYSGGVATFVYTPITGYVLNADGGIFSYAGGEAALSFNQNYPTANPNDYTVSAYLSTDSTYTARLSETSTINAIISASSTFNARLN